MTDCTMTNWLTKGAEKCLPTIYRTLHGSLMQDVVFHTDETPKKALHPSNGKAATAQS